MLSGLQRGANPARDLALLPLAATFTPAHLLRADDLYWRLEAWVKGVGVGSWRPLQPWQPASRPYEYYAPSSVVLRVHLAPIDGTRQYHALILYRGWWRVHPTWPLAVALDRPPPQHKQTILDRHRP